MPVSIPAFSDRRKGKGRSLMKTNRRGFTLVELMIVLAIVGLFFGILVLACRSVTSGKATKEAATHDAETFVRELGWQVAGISCTDIDSDRDGYVSCTIAKKDGTSDFVECRGAYDFGHGCRIPKLRIDRAPSQ
jgi:prepilin-type N-terminal cleavage/methylation domain-containing protein